VKMFGGPAIMFSRPPLWLSTGLLNLACKLKEGTKTVSSYSFSSIAISEDVKRVEVAFCLADTEPNTSQEKLVVVQLSRSCPSVPPFTKKCREAKVGVNIPRVLLPVSARGSGMPRNLLAVGTGLTCTWLQNI